MHTCVNIVSLVFDFSLLFCSHNTKATTWLDPRLVKKAKSPEQCEDGGELFKYTRAHTDKRLTFAYSCTNR